MQVKLHNTLSIDTAEIEQTLNLYLSRLDDLVTVMKIDLSDRITPRGKIQYCIQLHASLHDGQQIVIEEIQSDVKIATQRIMDRLQRQILRRQNSRYHLAS